MYCFIGTIPAFDLSVLYLLLLYIFGAEQNAKLASGPVEDLIAHREHR